MLFKYITPSKIINVAFEQYIKTHSDYSVLDVLEDRNLDELRAMASGFALKEYLSAAINEKDITFQLDNGCLVFLKHNIKVCSLGPEVTCFMSTAYVDDKIKIYRGNKVAYSLADYREDLESLLLRVYSITLLFCHNSIVKGIENIGLSNDNNTKQIAFIA